MKRVSFSVGLSNTHGEPIPQSTRARLCGQTYSYLVDRFGGYTVMEVSGGWKDGVGREYREEGLLFWSDIESNRMGMVDGAASWLAEVWDQEAVMVTVENIEAMRYVGKQMVAA